MQRRRSSTFYGSSNNNSGKQGMETPSVAAQCKQVFPNNPARPKQRRPAEPGLKWALGRTDQDAIVKTATRPK